MVKWRPAAGERAAGAFHAGRFGGRVPGGLYFLDIREYTPAREVILLHPIWPDGSSQEDPHFYQAILYGWANGYYVRVHDFTTTTKYDTPDPALDNMRRYLW